MADPLCEVCGGRLECLPGLSFHCVACGTLYEAILCGESVPQIIYQRVIPLIMPENERREYLSSLIQQREECLKELERKKWLPLSWSRRHLKITLSLLNRQIQRNESL